LKIEYLTGNTYYKYLQPSEGGMFPLEEGKRKQE